MSLRRWLSSHPYSDVSSIPFREARNWPGGHPAGASTPPPMRFVYAVLGVLALGLLVLAVNVYQLHVMNTPSAYPNHIIPSVEAREDPEDRRSLSAMVDASRTPSSGGEENDPDRPRPTVWIHGRKMESGYLNHVFQVFRRLGYRYGTAGSDWDVLWAHDYPFTELASIMLNLKPHQKVNHFPGSGFITNKVSLATSNLTYVPKAFRLPEDKAALFYYAKTHPNKMFVQKNNRHRGIKVEKITNLNLTQNGSFVQEFIRNPLLIDGRKFDLGVYTILTSIDPLRVYAYEGDAIIRFCSLEYLPFDPEKLDKYVVGDEYTPIWEIPSLKNSYETLGYTMKETLNAYLRMKGKNPEKIWTQVEAAIREVLLEMEPKLIAISSKYKSSRNFYEMVRFDFVVDEDLNVYIMEANMSPNLSSAHFPANRLIYEQVIFNTLSVVGLASWLHIKNVESSETANEMRVSNKDLSVYADLCNSPECQHNCRSRHCELCRQCLDTEWLQVLRDAFLEHANRQHCRRIFPPATPRDSNGRPTVGSVTRPINEKNRRMTLWFVGKCLQDETWCR